MNDDDDVDIKNNVAQLCHSYLGVHKVVWSRLSNIFDCFGKVSAQAIEVRV